MINEGRQASMTMNAPSREWGDFGRQFDNVEQLVEQC
jgi:hypothetical protein